MTFLGQFPRQFTAIRHLMIAAPALLLWSCGPPESESKQVIKIPVATKKAEIPTPTRKVETRSMEPKSTKPRQPMPQPLFAQAAHDGKIDVVRSALQSGTNVNIADENGRTPLMLAAFNGHTEVVRLLIDAGAKVPVRDAVGRTALMYASTGPSADTVKLLIESGAKVNAADSHERWTALMWAAAEGQRDVVRVLLEKGADPNLKDDDGDTAASFARRNNHTEVVALLRKAEQGK